MEPTVKFVIFFFVLLSFFLLENNWTETKFSAHRFGVTSISWADSGNRFVTGGCDKTVTIWTFNDAKWEPKQLKSVHQGWVRDVAWAPNIGLPYDTIASCSQVCYLFIYLLWII